MTKKEMEELRIDIYDEDVIALQIDWAKKLFEALEQAQAEIERLDRASKTYRDIANRLGNELEIKEQAEIEGYKQAVTHNANIAIRYRKAIDEAIFLTNLDESVDRPLTTLAKIKIMLCKALDGSEE